MTSGLHPADSRPPRARLLECSRLMLVTAGRGDVAELFSLVTSALLGGVRCVQLREPGLPARQLAELCARLLPECAALGALLVVNDRVDVAAAGCCHGVHLGHRSLRPAAARRVLAPELLVGFSAHDEEQLAEAAAAGCDYAVLAPVLPTSSKPGAAALGLSRAGNLTRNAKLPVLWLGGLAESTVSGLGAVPREQRPRGIAVRSALCDAPDVAAAARRLLASVRSFLD